MVKGGLQLASGVSTHTGQRKKAGHQKQNKIQNKEIRRLMRIRFIFFLKFAEWIVSNLENKDFWWNPFWKHFLDL